MYLLQYNCPPSKVPLVEKDYLFCSVVAMDKKRKRCDNDRKKPKYTRSLVQREEDATVKRAKKKVVA
jgi:hypothetical protein